MVAGLVEILLPFLPQLVVHRAAKCRLIHRHPADLRLQSLIEQFVQLLLFHGTHPFRSAIHTATRPPVPSGARSKPTAATPRAQSPNWLDRGARRWWRGLSGHRAGSTSAEASVPVDAIVEAANEQSPSQEPPFARQ